MDFTDHTQTLWSVIRQETYPKELRAQDRERLFGEWLDANPEAVAEMEGWAMRLYAMGKPVSVQYLFEKERYEGTVRLNPVPFVVEGGETRSYSINHNDRALFGRWLQRRHPGMRVRTRRSRFDKEGQ